MGCGMSSEDKEGKVRNEAIENQLKKDKMMQRNEIKMLLLGKLETTALADHKVSIVDASQALVNLESPQSSSK